MNKVNSADLNGAALAGNFTINNNTASITFSIKSDLLTEGTEELTMTSQGQTITVNVNDTSTTPVVVVPPGAIQFDADYVLLTYEFTTGRDLDTRTVVLGNNIAGTGQAVGWRQGSAVLNYLTWGGDNTGLGKEAALINLQNIRNTYPGVTDLRIDCRAHWFGSVGTTPVKMLATMFKGGTMVTSGFTWTNPTATSTANLASFSTAIVNKYPSHQRVAIFTYNIPTNVGNFAIA